MNTMDDLISRQAAIDALDNIRIPRNASWYPYYQQALTAVSKLPSARPEIIRCKDCKYAHLTVSGECKYCDAWTDDDGYPMEIYEDGDFFCGNAERKEI